ncbi:MAG: hypothetical protein WDW36_008281 [Sanguina aurantia]
MARSRDDIPICACRGAPRPTIVARAHRSRARSAARDGRAARSARRARAVAVRRIARRSRHLRIAHQRALRVRDALDRAATRRSYRASIGVIANRDRHARSRRARSRRNRALRACVARVRANARARAAMRARCIDGGSLASSTASSTRHLHRSRRSSSSRCAAFCAHASAEFGAMRDSASLLILAGRVEQARRCAAFAHPSRDLSIARELHAFVG